ncbi:MAG: S1 RNA-binding domain-containing protein, partial [Phycisphaerae bacterium]
MSTPLSDDQSPAIKTPGVDEPAATAASPVNAGRDGKPVPDGIDGAQIERELADALAGVDMQAVAEQATDTPHDNEFKPGELLRGAVLSCNEREVLVDLGGKAQGVVPCDEFLPGYEPPVGLELNVLIDRYDRDAGIVRLSKKRADAVAQWNELKVG